MLSPEIILGKILRLPEKDIREAFKKEKYQIVRQIKKKGGGCRTIYVPSEPLKKIQKKILRRVFQKMESIRFARVSRVYGLLRGGSYIAHARVHKEAKWVFQFDLADAFPSADISVIKNALIQKFTKELKAFKNLLEYEAYYLKELNEKAGKKFSFSIFAPFKEELQSFPDRFQKLPQMLGEWVIELTTFEGILPQGTPTAPFLFYLFLMESGILEEIERLLMRIFPESQDRYKFEWSVYVDNFVISAQKPIPPATQKKVFEVLEKHGLKPNPRKTKFQCLLHGAPMITGLRIANGKVSLPKKKIRQYRGLIHQAIFNPKLRKKVEGIIASIKPIYGENLPPQLQTPYQRFKKGE